MSSSTIVPVATLSVASSHILIADRPISNLSRSWAGKLVCPKGQYQPLASALSSYRHNNVLPETLVTRSDIAKYVAARQPGPLYQTPW